MNEICRLQCETTQDMNTRVTREQDEEKREKCDIIQFIAVMSSLGKIANIVPDVINDQNSCFRKRTASQLNHPNKRRKKKSEETMDSSTPRSGKVVLDDLGSPLDAWQKRREESDKDTDTSSSLSTLPYLSSDTSSGSKPASPTKLSFEMLKSKITPEKQETSSMLEKKLDTARINLTRAAIANDLDGSPGIPAVPNSRNKRRLIISPETQGNRSRKVSINDDRSPRVRSPILHVKTPGADAFTQDNFDGSRRRAMSTNIKPRNKKKPVRRLSLSDTNNKEARQRLITELLKSTVKKCCSQEVFGVEGDVKGPSDGEEEN